MDDITIEILPSGHMKIKRGNKAYNEKMREIISFMCDGDEEVLKNIDEFLIGSEDSELLIGDTIFCG